MLNIMQFPRISANITPSFCTYDCIATYAAHEGVPYETMYISALNKRFLWQSDLGLGRSVKDEFFLEDSLNKNTALRLTKFSGSFDEARDSIIEKICKKNVISIYIRGRYCPWDWRYNEAIAGAHAFFLVHYDYSSKQFSCIDPYYNLPMEYIDLANVQKGYLAYSEYSIDLGYRYREPMILLEEQLNGIKTSGCLMSFNEMGKHLREGFNPHIEIHNFNPHENYSMDELHDNIYLNMAMKCVTHNMLCFSVLLNKYEYWYPFLGKKFAMFAEEMKILSEKWEMTRFMLLKLIYAKNYVRISNAFSNRIDDLLKDEINLIDRILDLISAEGFCADGEPDAKAEFLPMRTVKPFEHKERKINCLDLSGWFNCKGIGCADETIADLNGIGEFIVDASMPTGMIQIGEMAFELPEIRVNENDNITCCKQNIDVQVGYCNEIAILGCSEWGGFKDYINIVYKDGYSERVLVELPIWTALNIKDDNPNFIECIKSINDEDFMLCGTENCYLHAKCYGLSHNEPIVKIELPECENMHIFAISLNQRA